MVFTLLITTDPKIFIFYSDQTELTGFRKNHWLFQSNAQTEKLCNSGGLTFRHFWENLHPFAFCTDFGEVPSPRSATWQTDPRFTIGLLWYGLASGFLPNKYYYYYYFYRQTDKVATDVRVAKNQYLSVERRFAPFYETECILLARLENVIKAEASIH